MTGALHRYPSYRESPLPWAVEFPSHWRVLRGKNIFRESTLPVRGGDGVVTCFRDGQVTLRANRRTAGFTNAIIEGGYQGVRKGQLVIHAMDAFAGAIGVSESDGKCTPEYAVCDPIDDANPSYFARLLRVVARLEYIRIECPAVRERAPRFRYPTFANMAFPVPPPDEQAAIVRFLDHVGRRIRRYIHAKQKLIKLLEEQKQAIIHQAVTRGLDPNVRVKPSGVEWLGEVPEHWALTPNRAYLKVRKILVGERHSEFQLLSLTKQGVIIRDTSSNKGKFSADMGTSQEVRNGDLVFCLFDVPETPRTVGLSPYDGMITGAYTVMECLDPSLTPFIERFYIAMDNRKLLSPLYSGLRNTIPKARLLGAKTPIPPAAEVGAILKHIQAESARFDARLCRTRRELELVREYQDRLIADVVTGTLDIRAASAALPEELDGPTDDLAIEDETVEDDALDPSTEETDE